MNRFAFLYTLPNRYPYCGETQSGFLFQPLQFPLQCVRLCHAGRCLDPVGLLARSFVRSNSLSGSLSF